MRANYQIVFTRVNLEIMYRHGWHVPAHFVPAGTTIERHVYGHLSTYKQQVPIAMILTHDVDRLSR